MTMPPVYAIGDIHGHIAQLERALELVIADGGHDAQVIFIGDYVDRGPNSKAVIETLQAGLSEGRNWTCLKGNHDRLFERFLAEPEPLHDAHLMVGYHWLHDALGGAATIASYGVDVPDRIRQHDLATRLRAAVPDAHKAFLGGLKLKHQIKKTLFVHAGIRPGVPVEDQVEDDLIWIRQEFLFDTTDHWMLVVHGHTPVDAPELHTNRLAIDTGAGYGRPLRPVVIDEEGVFALSFSGRERLSVIRN